MSKTLLKIALLLGVLAAIAVGVSFLFPEHRAPSPRPFPNPNGYERLVAAGNLVSGTAKGIETLDQSSLALVVSANSNVLQLAREGLRLESQVPVKSSREYMTTHVNAVGALRKLSSAFAAESRLAEFEGRFTNAAASTVDLVELAQKTSRGGLLIDSMIDVSIEAKAIRDLKTVVPHLDAATCRSITSRLESLETQRESFQEVIDREREWMRHYPGTFRERLGVFIGSRSIETVLAKSQKRFHERRTETRRVIIETAARAFELERGRKPGTVSELVPEFLKSIPVDSATGTNILNLR